MRLSPNFWTPRIPRSFAFCPSMKILPSSSIYSRTIIFMSVDFPAPFSPQRACTSPRSTSKSNFFKARTPGKDLVIRSVLITILLLQQNIPSKMLLVKGNHQWVHPNQPSHQLCISSDIFLMRNLSSIL